MKIVTAAEMRAIDRATSERFGVPSLALMENAGKAVADHALAEYAWVKKITVVCGKGNNGGDGFAAARHLHKRGKAIDVILLANPDDLRGDAAAMFKEMPVRAAVVTNEEELRGERVGPLFEADLYVDAILGTGFKPPVTGLYAAAIALMNAAEGRVVAVDIPSGADADASGAQQGIVCRADSIVTFTAPRPAHLFGALTRGTTCVAGIGSPEESISSSLQLNVTTARDFASMIAPRPQASNKGNYGHVLIVGGSLGKAGAAAMAGISALRAGAGLSTVATSKSAQPSVAGFYPELMTEPLPETEAGAIATGAGLRIEELFKTMTVVAIGPGISRDPHTVTLIRSLVASHTTPMVLDADGLNAFEGHTDELNGKGRTLVITPHPGEMARLAACSTSDVQKDRLGVARRFAREHQLIVVLKGHRSLVVQPDGEAWVNTTGNPGMSTGGTGDILTGMVAGMVAQNPNDRLKAVCAAVYLHGLAGDVMRDSVGEHSMIATDLLLGLPEAFRRARQASRTDLVCWNG
jgi:ADP-dependent NAD(P)H-hydrate dehydratase / NAD(P)H-hydrate epimerase